MKKNRIRWTQGAKALGGLASVLTLLAHFWLPQLPLTTIRVELLLFLIGALLGLDMLTEYLPGLSDNQPDKGETENGS
jgi:hypothetical protein